MNLPKRLFWDVDVSKLDMQKHKGHIIPRVFMRGRLDNMKEVIDHYGREEVKNTLLQTRYLDKKTLAFTASVFDVPKEDFRCYKLSQFMPQIWDY